MRPNYHNYSSIPTESEDISSPVHQFDLSDLEQASTGIRKDPLKRRSSRHSSNLLQSTFWATDEDRGGVRKGNMYGASRKNRYSRIVDRNNELFAQSGGKTHVAKRMNLVDRLSFYKMDWFHSLIDAPTSRIILILMTLYLTLVFIFAFFYYEIYRHSDCHLELFTFLDAFLFSLETFATIGYGAPGNDIFYNECLSVTAVLTVQCCLRIVVDSISIGVLYSRLARPSSRASTIIFSDKAIIRRIRGKLYFMFQLCELRKHQLVEAHIRLYVIKHEVDPSLYLEDQQYYHQQQQQQLGRQSTQSRGAGGRREVPFHVNGYPATNPHIFIQSCTMRLNHPNDELGAMLLLMLPQVVVHELDISSPLMPPPLWISSLGEVIRWNPPVYRLLRRPRREATVAAKAESPSPSSSSAAPHPLQITHPSDTISPPREQQEEEENSEDFDIYDAEVVSNIEFPSVTRRGIDIYANSTPPPPPPTSKESSGNSAAGNYPSASRATAAAPQKQKPHSLLVESLHYQPQQQQQQQQQYLPSHSSKSTNLESPGLQRYHSDLNILARTANASSSAYSSRDNSMIQRDKAATFNPSPHPPPSYSSSSMQQPQPMRYYHFDDSLINHPSITPPGPGTYVPPSPATPPFSYNRPDLEEGLKKEPPKEEQEEEDEEDWNEEEPAWQVEEKAMIMKYLLDRKIEIIAVVEGVDATTGGNLQARHSYTCADIAWDKTFANCIFPGGDDGTSGMLIDFDYFHKLRDAPKDAAYPGPIASSI